MPVTKKLPAEKQRAIVADYMAGEKLSVISLVHGVGVSSVKKYANRLGAPRRASGPRQANARDLRT